MKGLRRIAEDCVSANILLYSLLNLNTQLCQETSLSVLQKNRVDLQGEECTIQGYLGENFFRDRASPRAELNYTARRGEVIVGHRFCKM